MIYDNIKNADKENSGIVINEFENYNRILENNICMKTSFKLKSGETKI